MNAVAVWVRRHRTALAVALTLIVLTVGLAALHRLIIEIRLSDIRNALRDIQPIHIALCIGLTATSYLALTLYDFIALRIIGRPLPWRTAAIASFTSVTLSHNLGLGWLTGGSARYRIYTEAGLDGPDVARIIAIASGMFWVGVVLIAGTGLSLHQGALMIGTWSLSPVPTHAIGVCILVAGSGFLVLCATGPRQLRILNWTLPLPSGRQAAAQYAIAALDLAAASAALFVLVPGADPALLPSFVLAYSIAIIVAVVSNVPGGVGVFESVLVALLPGEKPMLLAALIAYRIVYYVLPLALGVTLLAFREGAHWRAPATRAISGLHTVVSLVAPLGMATASLLGGSILLLSGSLPASPSRLGALERFVPLPFMEASHIAASLIGTALLLLAPGLLRRLDGAFIATRALLLAGALFSLLKGFDYEEATVCIAIAALLQWTRPAFYRRTALTGDVFSLPWIAGIATLLVIATWVGLFAYKHVEYENELWWQFAFNADAPRFLRATLAALLLMAVFAAWRLLSADHIRATPLTTDVESIRPALRSARHTDAMLAFAGDKRFLLSSGRDAFLMYQVRGASWIVMADPVGPREQWPELLWEIRSMADASQGRLLLYQISAEMLELAVELGLQVIKYGEEAVVKLADLSLEGSTLRGLRQATNRAEREGLTFTIVPATQVLELLPDLAPISTAWLKAKGQSEKGFSLGRFDPAYLAEFDCAVVRRNGKILAFANVLVTPDHGVASIDLMRHGDDAPSGTMDFLFIKLMLWAKAEGFRSFSIGLAPLSGIAARRLSPAWAKIAGLLFNHGERFYGFRGLRSYKAKFHPGWLPRYIAGPRGMAIIPALVDLIALIGTPARDTDPETRK